MNIKKIVEELFGEIVEDYENEKMIRNGGLVKKTTASEFVGGRDNV